MVRKIFISILGTGFYSKCKYTSENFISSNTRFAQQAVLELSDAKNWNKESKVILFLTDFARKNNWDITERLFQQKEVVRYKGLKHVLDEMNLPVEIKDVSIPDGKNEEEMWEIFNTIFSELEEKDEVYMDLTHSFRYLPMLLLVLSNYAKFLKNITIKHLSYGNFEARNTETNEAPIIDLLPITFLQDWTFAAADYLKNGNVDRLSEMSKTTLTPILSKSKGKDESVKQLQRLIQLVRYTTEDFQTCRGMNIINATNIGALKNVLEDVQSTFIQPLNPVIKRIKSVLHNFEESYSVNNGIAAAQWCYTHGLYQQAATTLQESVVSYFCIKNNFEINDENRRDIINKAFRILSMGYDSDESQWIIKDEYRNDLREILKDDELNKKELQNAFARLTELRNDINHCGMRKEKAPMTAERIKNNLKRDLNLFQSKLLTDFSSTINVSEKTSLLINLTNHPFEQWDEKQKEASLQFGSCIDMPFPAIDPTADEEEIENIAEEYLQKIITIGEKKNARPVVHLMGEMTFMHNLTNKLKENDIRCIASTSKRISNDLGNGQKQINFQFVRFRDF